MADSSDSFESFSSDPDTVYPVQLTHEERARNIKKIKDYQQRTLELWSAVYFPVEQVFIFTKDQEKAVRRTGRSEHEPRNFKNEDVDSAKQYYLAAKDLCARIDKLYEATHTINGLFQDY